MFLLLRRQVEARGDTVSESPGVFSVPSWEVHCEAKRMELQVHRDSLSIILDPQVT